MKHYWFYWPMALTTLPAFVLFVLFVLVFYGVEEWGWRAGCLEFVAKRDKNGRTRIWGRPQGQCWGTPAMVFSSSRVLAHRVIPVHERVHAIHGILLCTAGAVVFTPLGLLVWWPLMLLGPMVFVIAYVGHFLFEWALRGFKQSEFWHAYLRIWSERYAYRIDDEYERGLRPEAWGG
jgi:hypothetical protein